MRIARPAFADLFAEQAATLRIPSRLSVRSLDAALDEMFDAIRGAAERGIFDLLTHAMIAGAQRQASDLLPGLVSEAFVVRTPETPRVIPLDRYGRAELRGTVWDVSNPRANQYLRTRSADLVRNIDETTRKELRRILGEGSVDGKSSREIGRDIRRQFAYMAEGRPQRHIRSRAEGIATTEMAFAYEKGKADLTAQVATHTGLAFEKSWLTVGDGRVDQLCSDNAGDGWIDSEDRFPSGVLEPPAHPYCRCTTQYRAARAGQDRRADPLRGRLERPTPSRVARDPVLLDLPPAPRPRATPLRIQTPTVAVEASVRRWEETAVPRTLVDRHEIGAAFDAETGEMIGSELRGTTARTPIHPDVLARMNSGRGQSVIYTHTHPQDTIMSAARGTERHATGISAGDVKIAIEYNLREMRAVTDEWIHVFRSPEGGWGATRAGRKRYADLVARTFRKEKDLAERAWYAEQAAARARGEVLPWRDSVHEAWVALGEKHGLPGYSRIPRVPGVTTTPSVTPTITPPVPTPAPRPAALTKAGARDERVAILQDMDTEEAVALASKSWDDFREVMGGRYGIDVEIDPVWRQGGRVGQAQAARASMVRALDGYRKVGIDLRRQIDLAPEMRPIRLVKWDDTRKAHPLQKGGSVPASMGSHGGAMTIHHESSFAHGRLDGYGIYRGQDGFEALVQHETGHAIDAALGRMRAGTNAYSKSIPGMPRSDQRLHTARGSGKAVTEWGTFTKREIGGYIRSEQSSVQGYEDMLRAFDRAQEEGRSYFIPRDEIERSLAASRERLAALEAARDAAGVKRKIPPEMMPSDYGANNEAEDIAETFWRWINTPDWFEASPSRRAIMEDAVRDFVRFVEEASA